MGIHSIPFGPVILTGEDVRAFEKAIQKGPSKKAKDAYKRGEKMARLLKEQGYVVITPKESK